MFLTFSGLLFIIYRIQKPYFYFSFHRQPILPSSFFNYFQSRTESHLHRRRSLVGDARKCHPYACMDINVSSLYTKIYIPDIGTYSLGFTMITGFYSTGGRNGKFKSRNGEVEAPVLIRIVI